MKRYFLLFLVAILFNSCTNLEHGDTTFSVGNINLTASFLGYGKDHDGNEDILVKNYSSGDLRTFCDFTSYPENKNPYIIKTSTIGADNRSNNIIQISLSFSAEEIDVIKINIETNAEHINSFYLQAFLNETEVKKETLSSGDKEISINTEINKILIYVDAPKFYNGIQLNDYFKFNYCLPYIN
ncbi:MAG: hypothetical protein IJ207_06845 [Treponema sp.]|uniref:hypothetical protein n=1 Tax=Treponema sp. TaxID=166 RepID=UPI0025FEA71F|nr:hypothetical protein [Treponema sp.]MBQ9281901.1 hypothetical protein [Treponema sp.]